MDHVQDDGTEMMAGGDEPTREKQRFGNALRVRRAHERETRAIVAQQLTDLLGPLAKTREERRKCLEELRHVAKQAQADHVIKKTLDAAAEDTKVARGAQPA